MTAETAAELHTIIDLIRYGTSRFNEAGLTFGHSYDNALDEATQLVLHSLHLPHDLGPAYGQARLLQAEKLRVLELFQRRIDERIPAAYLTGEAWFAGLSFKSDKRALVPRSPIAELIECGFEPWLAGRDVYRALDLCTGSGCIAIAMGHYYPNWQVDGVDLSDDALSLAEENRERLQAYNVNLIKSDLFNGLSGRHYDLIVTNPPYVTNDETDALPKEYSYEPEMGLRAGDDGLDLVLKILRDAPLHLSEDGLLICEVGESEQHLIKLLPEVDFAWIEFKVGQMGIFAVECRELIAHSARITELAAQRPWLNSFGKLFTVTTFGESHGPAIGCVIDGCPPGLALDAAEFAHDLQRRATGKSRHTSARREADEVEILSGVYEGLTTGTPIALLIRNTDQRSKDYANIGQQFRPGHADYSYWHKYGIRDPRGGGRSSARETTMRVAAGVVAKKWLAERFGVTVRGYLSQLGDITPAGFDWSAVEDNPFFWPHAAQVPELEAYMDALRKSGDSVGARVDVVADNVPPGWGEPIYGKLDGELAAALMSINAVKGVEIGDGFASAAQKGTEHRDLLTPQGFASNHAGGILGGISTGQPVVASIALKPTSSLRLPGPSLDTAGNVVEVVTTGRHDPCVGIRATPIAEAMVAMVLMDQALRHRAQCGDVGTITPRIPGQIDG